MEYIYIGKIVDTHGIKGELRLISDFDFKDKVFKKNMQIYIGKDKKKETITSYRPHKQYDMITLDGYNDINMVLGLLKENVYINQKDLELERGEVLDSSLIGLQVYSIDDYLGEVIEIFKPSPNSKVIRFKKDDNFFLVPYVKTLIKDIEIHNKKIILHSTEGVIKCE